MDLEKEVSDPPTNGDPENEEQTVQTPDREPEIGDAPSEESEKQPAFSSYSKEEVDAFMLQPDDVENPEMKDAAASLLHEAKFPNMETFEVTAMFDSRTKSETLVMDYEKELIQIGTVIIKSTQIRFAHLNRIEDTTTGYEVVVSYITEDNEIRLFHIMCPGNVMAAIGALNGLQRLTYKLYKTMSATVQEFRAARQKSLPMFTGSLQNLSLYNLETKKYEAEKEGMYLYLDMECLMILKSQFLEMNSYQMFFWKEAVPESVDKVMITHDTGTLNIATQRMRLEIHQFKEGRANDLFNCIRDLRPEPRGSFTDHAGRLEKIRIPNAVLGDIPVPESVAGNSQSGAMYYDDKTRIDNTRLTTFQDDLRNAVRQFENLDEIGLPWVIAEDEIKRMLEDGSVSETDLLSGGLDPNNLDHFMKCVEEIENQLKQQDYEKALSRLQATKKIFMECNLNEMKSLLSLDDITLLKQMYFHSFA